MLQSGGKTVHAHLDSLEAQIVESLEYNNCVKINIHGGKDSWSWEETQEYFTGFLALENKYNQSRAASGLAKVPMLHETHRGRILYAPWTTMRVMQAFPTLLFTADLSHWVVVAERHLNADDEFDVVMKLIFERSQHIHARPSSTQHIQLYDLEDPVYESDLNAFKSYWRSIIATQIARGNNITVDPEFGPFPYALSGVIAGNTVTTLETNIHKVMNIVTQIHSECLHEAYSNQLKLHQV